MVNLPYNLIVGHQPNTAVGRFGERVCKTTLGLAKHHLIEVAGVLPVFFIQPIESYHGRVDAETGKIIFDNQGLGQRFSLHPQQPELHARHLFGAERPGLPPLPGPPTNTQQRCQHQPPNQHGPPADGFCFPGFGLC